MATEIVGDVKKFASEFIESKFEAVKNELLDELRAEKEIVIFDLVSSLVVSDVGVRKVNSEVRRFRSSR